MLRQTGHQRDRAKIELDRAQKQIAMRSVREVDLGHQISLSYPDLRTHINALSRVLTDTRMRESSISRHEGDRRGYEQDRQAAERMHLLQTVQRQDREIHRSKAEAMGKRNEAVSRSWQGSVVSCSESPGSSSLARHRDADFYRRTRQ